MNAIFFTSAALLTQVGIRHVSNPTWLKTVIAIVPLALLKFSSSPLARLGIVSLALYNVYVVCSHKKSHSPQVPRPQGRADRLPQAPPLRHEGDLILGNHEIHTLRPGMTITGNLILRDCSELTQLPPGLSVGRDLDLNGCTALTALPADFSVGGDLNLRGCTALTALPQNLDLGGDLVLANSGLTSLANWITTLGRSRSGHQRTVDLTNTRLSEDVLARLRTHIAAHPPEGMQFIFSHVPAPEAQEFLTLVDLRNFWRGILPGEEEIPLPTLSPDDTATVLRFFSRVLNTAEYRNAAARPSLAKRVLDSLYEMYNDPSFCERCIEIMRDAEIACDDRIISGMDDLELALRIRWAKQESRTSEELRGLARGLLHLQAVDQAVDTHIATLHWVDPIEVRMAFRYRLADSLRLPISTRAMLFRGCAQISDQQIDAIGRRIEGEITEASLETYLTDWESWQIFQRREEVRRTSYESIAPAAHALPSGTVCSITQDAPENPVLCNGRWYDYAALSAWFIEKGEDPVRVRIIWSALQR